MNSVKRNDIPANENINGNAGKQGVGYYSYLRIFLSYLVPVILFIAYYFYQKAGK
jgi:hypothetical protein